MIERLRALLTWSRTHQGKKMVRYVLGSVIATGVSFTSIAILYGFRIIPGVIWATLAGNLIATLPAYHLNRTWTWGKRGRSHFRNEIVPFWSMSFLGIAFSQFGAFWSRAEVHSHTWSHLANTALVTGTNLVCFGVFFMLKLMVFNKIFHVNKLELLDEHLTLEEKSAI
ncbi:MAG TPA: GtrA family protein [Acidimicrobiales bacterium]|jgi:putative flippase GtrA|nr:GtrA family protein [Acidimicrobiales bacterium]